jgi:hypothetical protein
MTAEYQRPETRPSYSDESLAAAETPGYEAVRQVTTLALVGIEADYVPDEFIRT